MTTKELIIKLLDLPMDEEIVLFYPKEHTNEHGKSIGYIFHVDDVNCHGIVFTDWREKNDNG